MTSKPLTITGDLSVLEQLAQVLDRCAVLLWARVDERPANDPGATEIAGLASDFFFAHAHVAHLLPIGHVIVGSTEPSQTSAAVLADRASCLVRDLPLDLQASAASWAPSLTLGAVVGDLAERSRAANA